MGAFYFRKVIKIGRDISLCHPELQQKAEKLVSACRGQGLLIGIGECFRTVAEQDALYAKGRTAPGSIVTNAKEALIALIINGERLLIYTAMTEREHITTMTGSLIWWEQ